MRAFVTGGKGFVGSWLVEHLRASGDDVVAVDSEVDVTDAEAVRRAVAASEPEAVYHLAAFSHVGRSWDDRAAVVTVNTVGTAAVLDACRRLPSPPRVLVVSSAEVYGTVGADRQPVGEDQPMRPVTPYAASKAAAEMLAVQAHLGDGVPVVRVRPFNHIGPGQADSFVVPALAARIVAAQRDGSRELRVGNLSARRDLTDVRDVVRAYRLLLAGGGEPGAVYNVCSGRAVAIGEIAGRLLALAGASLELQTDPDLMRPVDVPVMCGDGSRLAAATGWAPAVALDDTLTAVLDEQRRRA